MWNWCPSLEFLIAQTQSSAEWHLPVSWACSLSTCWCDLFALWSFSSLFCRPGMWPFSKASYLAVPAPESPPPRQKGHRGCLFVSARRRWKTQIPHTNIFSSCYHLGRSFLLVNVCVLWVKKDRGRGQRNQAAENPKYLPRHPWHVVWIPWSAQVHIFLQGRCCPTLLQHVCSHACRDVSLTCWHASWTCDGHAVMCRQVLYFSASNSGDTFVKMFSSSRHLLAVIHIWCNMLIYSLALQLDHSDLKLLSSILTISIYRTLS